MVSARLLGLSYQQVQESFERNFRELASTRSNIRLPANRYKRTGNVLDE
jgi:hypothetical protein